MNSNKDEALAETNTTQYQGFEEPRSSAWLLVEIIAVLLALVCFVAMVRRKIGVF